MRLGWMLVPVLAAVLQTANPPPPDTEIFLAPLSVAASQTVVGAPINITSNPGYDNQPSFTPDGRAVLFTSIRGLSILREPQDRPEPGRGPTGSGRGGQTDIYRYDIAGGRITRVTNTPESEYSPTVTPDGAHISVIRVEADGTQRLWRFTIDGAQPEVVLADVKPVGYHVWADDHTLALFVLGQPATLQVADTRNGKAESLVPGINRSLQRIPGGRTISFVQRIPSSQQGGAPSLKISELDPVSHGVTPLVNAVAGAREADCAWTPDGMLLMADKDVLYGWRRGQADWRRLVDLAALGLHGVSRLAVSPDGQRIAFVTGP